MDRTVNWFLGQFDMMYNKFYSISRNMICYLFKSLTSSFHGAELWFNGLQKINALQKMSMAYHKTIKKNHWIKFMVQQPCCILKHLQAKWMLKSIMSVVNSSSPCLLMHKYYFRFLSHISADIKYLLRVKCVWLLRNSDVSCQYKDRLCPKNKRKKQLWYWCTLIISSVNLQIFLNN